MNEFMKNFLSRLFDCSCPGLFHSCKFTGLMTTLLRTSWLAIAALLFAATVPAQAQTNVITNIITITNIVTVTNTVTSTNTISSTNQIRGKAIPAHPNIAAPTNNWKLSVSFGLSIARGNTDNTLASATAFAERKWTQNDLALGADGLYGETKTPDAPKYTRNAETLHGYSQYNRTLGDDFYAYARADGLHDGIADIKYRVTLSPGLGYYFVTNKTMDFSSEIGPGYIKEQLDGDTKSIAMLRLAEKLHYAISPRAKAWEAVEILPQMNKFDNYFVNAEVGAEAGLTKGNKLSLRTVLQDSYNNVPAAGRLRNDLKLIASLGYKF
jgi:putative salt-induced outer membrane protein YdiY